MQKKWRKTGAALLIAGLTVSGTGYALAEGGKVTEAIDLSQLGKEPVEETPIVVVVDSPVKEVVNEEETEVDANKAGTEADKDADKEGEGTESLPEIPEGYTAGNLAALAKAYEQAGSPNAKAAIKRNMERSIEKWESKQPVAEAPKEESKKETKVDKPAKEKPVTEKAPVQEEKQVKVKEKNPQAELNAKHKVEKEKLKAAQKAEREALKAERKAAKDEHKAAKEKQKQERKEKKN